MTGPQHARPSPGAPRGRALPPGGGERILGPGVDATVKATTAEGAPLSTFDVVIAPGYDVGAHVHATGQEFFYVLSGTLDLMCFEPVDRGVGDWHDWVSAGGERFLRGGPGSFMWVPEGVPHAFANPGDEPVTMVFQSGAPGGHENYFVELTEILGRGQGGPPDQQAISDLRDRYDIQQLTALDPGRR